MPPDISQCVFLIEQALSVRALQEIISSNDAEAVSNLWWEASLRTFLLFGLKLIFAYHDKNIRDGCLQLIASRFSSWKENEIAGFVVFSQ